MNETVYISVEKKIEIYKRQATVGDIAKVYCRNQSITQRVERLPLIAIPNEPSRRYVMSVMTIVELITKNIEKAEVQNLGETDFVICYYRERASSHKIRENIMVAFVGLIAFFGGAFAIMAYGNDIGINGLFSKIIEITNGSTKLLEAMQIAFSVGLAIGIVIFYDFFGTRKQSKDPSPLEIEMRMYEDDMETAIIKESEDRGVTL